MAEIVTLTINPTIDRSARVDQVVPDKKLRCDQVHREPGGGGLNVSRAIAKLGGTSRAIYTAGGHTGSILIDLLEAERLNHTPVPIQNFTRENIMIYEERSRQQYRFGMPGPELTEEDWRQCLQMLKQLSPPPKFLVASGSLPPGAPADFYARVADIAAQAGARCVLDAKPDALKPALGHGVFMIKPNEGEMRELMGVNEYEHSALREAAQQLIAEGRCEVISLSLGRAGVLLVTRDGAQRIHAPQVKTQSRIGAGDSMVGGIVLKLSQDSPLLEAVCYGVAAGTATMTPGSELCRREDANRLFREICGEVHS